MNPLQLKKLQQVLEKIESKYAKYLSLFEADGTITTKEQKKLDNIIDKITKIKGKLKAIEEGLRDKTIAKYIKDSPIPTEEVCRIDTTALLQPSKKIARTNDPFLIRKELLERLNFLNKSDKLLKKEITLEYSNGNFSISSADQNRYRLVGNAIEDTYTQVDSKLNNGITFPGKKASPSGENATQSKEELQKLHQNLKERVAKYQKEKAIFDDKLEVMQANIDSLLIEESDIMVVENFKRIYKGKEDSILDLATMLNDMAEEYRRACKEHYLKTGEQKFDPEIYKAVIINLNTAPYTNMAADWAAGELYDQLEQNMKAALPKSKVRATAEGEPKILKEHEYEVAEQDFEEKEIDLPYATTGAGDTAATELNDIDQGAIGDCYYMSSVGALVDSHPELFALNGDQSIVKEKGDKFIVTLHLRQDKDSLKRTPKEIEVSKKALMDSRPNMTNNGNPIYAGKADGELWVIALERALAQEMGGFDNIVGGKSNNAFEMLTGKTATTVQLATLTGSANEQRQYILSNLQNAQDNSYPVTLSTTGSGEIPINITDANGNAETLLQGHAYTFQKINSAGNAITLYDPHGRSVVITFNTLFEQFVSFTSVAVQ